MGLRFGRLENQSSQKKAQRVALLEQVQKEREAFTVFFADMKAKSSFDTATCQALVQSVKRVIERLQTEVAGDDSLFLKNTLKPLLALKAQAEVFLNSLEEQDHVKIVAPAQDEGSVFVYISLYQANGQDMRQWANLLRSLSANLHGRPVYAGREAVEAWVRSRLNPVPEAYVVVQVKRERVIEGERADKLGQPVLQLAPGAIELKQVVEFVHMKKRYQFANNQLSLMEGV